MEEKTNQLHVYYTQIGPIYMHVISPTHCVFKKPMRGFPKIEYRVFTYLELCFFLIQLISNKQRKCAASFRFSPHTHNCVYMGLKIRHCVYRFKGQIYIHIRLCVWGENLGTRLCATYKEDRPWCDLFDLCLPLGLVRGRMKGRREQGGRTLSLETQ